MNDYIYVIMHPLANNAHNGQADRRTDGWKDEWMVEFIYT